MVKKKGGWTLVELLVVLAILGFIVMIAPAILTQTTKFFLLGRTKLELQREARANMYLITREMRQAKSSTLAIDQVGGQPYYSRINFTKIQGTAVTISQTGSKLIIKEGIDTTILSKNLAYLAFTFPVSDDMTILSVSMTLQQQIYNGRIKALHMASERVRVMN